MDNMDKKDELCPPEVPRETTKSDTKAAKRKAGWLIRDLFDWGEVLVSAIVILVAVFTFAIRVTSVDGSSMTPSLFHHDQMLVTNFFYTPSRGDVVVVYAPELICNDKSERSGRVETGKDIIKRVIAVAGDRIQIQAFNNPDGDGRVYLNGSPLPLTDINGIAHDFIEESERYADFIEDGRFIRGFTRTGTFEAIDLIVPEGYVFVLGDNRTNSVDSRLMTHTNHGQGAMGLVNVNHIVGKAFFRVAGGTGCPSGGCGSMGCPNANGCYTTPWNSVFDAFGFVG
jgi:signal peptidase I